MTGTKILLKEVLLPVLGSFDGLELEYEMLSFSGVKIYGVVCHPIMRIVFERIASLRTLRKLRETVFHSKGHVLEVLQCLVIPIFHTAEMSLRKSQVCAKEIYMNG
ncbi:hypothetical protein [Paenibacillus sp. Soil766]|uniref:hypothetical protein n=1 Tax=Paenibacillus sp. Soil766 TaxID=1736404 RepID=UPI001F2A4EA6|nr:hypothetical protein [Paenibacillus sp. Soil766]